MNHEVDENVNKTAHGQTCKLYAEIYVNSSVSILNVLNSDKLPGKCPFELMLIKLLEMLFCVHSILNVHWAYAVLNVLSTRFLQFA